MKRLPIQAAKDIAKKYGQSQVILVTWDDNDHLMHTVSYGRTLKDCERAAQGANMVKRALGFPESMCNDKPARSKRKIKDTGKKLSKVEPKTVAKALGATPGTKILGVRMSRGAKAALAAAPEADRQELLSAIEKLASGEIQGTPMTEEEVDRLRDEEGIDLRAMAAEALDQADDPEKSN